ncbi:MAG: response regulator, partial [Candidatus Nealsonbacteria bacterium]|nr:response regulator [Candidatus Nealsonbacteria bacterium]
MPKILIIDDDKINQDILAQALKQNGYEVVSVFQAAECLDKIAEHRPDLILLDVLMPGLSGFDVLNLLKEKSIIPATPVIVLTALSEEANIRKVLELGAEDYWLKT